MKVFWVLAWDRYYPRGGLNNVVETFATREEAEEFVKNNDLSSDYVEITDVSHLIGYNPPRYATDE